MARLDRSKIPARWVADAQWIVWRYELTERATLTKVPYCPLAPRKASSTDPTTWSTLEVCERAVEQSDGFYIGVGHMQGDDPSVGLDYDHCLDDEGRINSPEVAAEVALLDSWTYITPSGEGLRVIVDGTWPDHGRKQPGLEVYARDRFFTVTDQLYGSSGPHINPRQAVIDGIYQAHFAPKPRLKRQVVASGPQHYSDDEAIRTLLGFVNIGRKVEDLMDGAWEQHYASESEADAGLAWYIQLVADGEDQIIRILRRSGLWDEKWERADYQRATLDFVAQRAQHYTPPPSRFERHARPERPEVLNGQVDVSEHADYIAQLEASHALLEEQVDALLAENANVRAHFTRIMGVIANAAIPHSDRLVLIATLNQTSSLLSRDQADESGRVHASPTAIAAAAGVSAKTAGKIIQQYDEIGVLDRHLARTPVPCTRENGHYISEETGEIFDKQPWVSELRVGMPLGTDATAVMLATLDATAVSAGKIKKVGGTRDPRPATCAEHPDSDVSIIEVIACDTCGEEVRRTVKRHASLNGQLVASESTSVTHPINGTSRAKNKNGLALVPWKRLELPALGDLPAAGA